jgi:hypothetical protein
MALVVADRVKETTTTTGTGTITLAGAEPNFITFTSALSDGDTTYYAIVDDANSDFEVGLGTFTASGTTLARTTVLASSNSGSAVNLQSGTKEVFINYPADKSVYLDGSDKVKFIGTTSVAEMIEKVDIPTSTTGTINFDFLSQAVQLYNTNQTANRTINFRGDGSNSLDSIMAVGESMTAAVLMKQGSSAYYLNAYQVDGSSVTPEWSGGSAPSAGNANSIDTYVFTIIKTASATFTVLASQSQYA